VCTLLKHCQTMAPYIWLYKVIYCTSLLHVPCSAYLLASSSPCSSPLHINGQAPALCTLSWHATWHYAHSHGMPLGTLHSTTNHSRFPIGLTCTPPLPALSMCRPLCPQDVLHVTHQAVSVPLLPEHHWEIYFGQHRMMSGISTADGDGDGLCFF
jgi:hypothetical protein